MTDDKIQAMQIILSAMLLFVYVFSIKGE